MTPEERIEYLSGELQVLAFNLLDGIESLNLHSPREAVADLNARVTGMAEEMVKLNRSLIHNLSLLKRDKELDEAEEMDSLLDILRHCSIEPASYKHFISSLIPLIKLLTLWSERGAAAGAGEKG